MPKVSVVLLTFNRSRLLKHAVQSVIDQTFQDFEIIIVDDCSTDGTEETVKSFSDDRIKYVRHEVNKGEGAGRNTGLRNARGEYIAYIDDDDEWLPEKLRLQVDCLDRSPREVGAVHCGRMNVDLQTGTVMNELASPETGNIFPRLLKGNFITLSSVLLRAECFNEVGFFDENIQFGLDYDMWLRVSQNFRFDYINEPLVRYGIHEKALSKNMKLQIKGQETWLRKYDKYLSQDPKTYHRRYCGLAILYCLEGEISQGRTIVYKAIKHYPKGPKAYGILLVSFFGSRIFRKAIEVWGKRFTLSS